MSGNKSTGRDYNKEYRLYQGTPEQIKNRAQRNAARAIAKKKFGAAAIAGKDIDHDRPIRSHGTNSLKNLDIESIKKNRGWNRGM